MAYDVFISHSSKDKAIADAVTAVLEQAKIRCWIAPRDIRPGDSWGGAIVKGIEICRVMVVVFSAQSNSSKQVMREVERAVQHDIVVVPFRIEDVQPTRDMEYFLSSTHWLDAVSPQMDAHLKELETTVCSILDTTSQTKKEPSSLNNTKPKTKLGSNSSSPPSTQTKHKGPSKLPILLTGLALTFLMGFISFSFFIDGDEPATQATSKNKPLKQAQNIEPRGNGDVKLDAVESAYAGGTVSISWSGKVLEGDYILITAFSAADHVKSNLQRIGANTSIEAKLSNKPGKYQIRFVDSAKNKIIARKTLEVVSPNITIDAPKQGLAGKSISVSWTGPNYRSDYLSIAKPEQIGNRYTNFSYIANGSPTSIRLPDSAGEYELRYISGSGREIWHKTNITVNAAEVSIVKLDAQIAGAEIPVKWSGPANKGDYLAVAELNAEAKDYLSYQYVKPGNDAKLRLPARAGTFQIRYISGQNKEIWASSLVETQMPVVSLKTPNESVVGTALEITWEGPANRSDHISIAEPGSEGNEYLSYRYVRANRKAGIQVPQIPGKYVIRYISGADKSVWYEAPLTVTARSETLTFPNSVMAGKSFDVRWQSKGQPGEYIAIFADSATDDAAYLSYANTNNRTKTNLKAPAEPGQYQVRYISGNKKVVWGRESLTVKAP